MKVFEVLYDADAPGPAGDGTHVARFLERRHAEEFAGQNTHYGQPTNVSQVDASSGACERWVFMERR